MRLTREIRFSLLPGDTGDAVTNSWGGWPTHGGVAPYLVLRVTVSGRVDQPTGYLCNIAVVDRHVRERVVPALRSRWLATRDAPSLAEQMVVLAGRELQPAFAGPLRCAQVELAVTPYLRYRWSSGAEAMVSMTQSFEFAAAHRLHCPQLSDADNRATFGKCNNPHYHGHNYVLEVTVSGAVDPASGVLLPVGVFEQVVKTEVIDVFDHQNLSIDCPAFANLNPSVENITRVIWDRLVDRFAPARLTNVRVYETPKTYAECSAADEQ